MVRGAQRRIGWAGLVGLALVATLVLAACGGGDDGGEGPAGGGTNTAEDVDPAGVLRVNFELNTPRLELDPIEADSPVPFWVHYMIYDTLLRQRSDGSYEPGLAQSATIVDPSTIEVVLKPNLEFQDGTPLDAEAARFSILRIKDANEPRAFRMAELSQLRDIEVTSPTTFTIHLAQPIAGAFYNLLAHNETLIVSPAAAQAGTLPDQPVGAGPFRFVSRDSETLVLEKWDGFHDADAVRLARVEVVNINAANQPALINGLRSGAVDAAVVEYDSVAQLQDPTLETDVAVNPDSVIWVGMQCQAYPELQDERVRQALNYATDKEALNQALTGGEGEPMSQFIASDSQYFNEDIADAYEYDPERARELLEEAGATDLHLTMGVAQQGGVQLRTGEILQQQWEEVGVELELVATADTVTDYYINKNMMTYPTVQSRFWTDKITRNFMPGSVGNTCDPQSPEFTAMVNELSSLDPESPEAVELWKDIQAFLSEGAYAVYGIINVEPHAWNHDRVGNPTWRPNQLGDLYPDPLHMYIRR